MPIAMQYGSGTGSSSKRTGMAMTLIWTNTDPSSSFAAQTVAVDLAGYDAVAIRTLFSTSSQQPLPLGFYICDNTLTCYIPLTARTTNNNGGRLFTFEDDGMAFQAGYYSGSSNNAYAIPYQIYGVKF